MNDVINAILKRRSVRNYMSIIPPHDEIKMIIDCGLFAPTARGIQPWFFSVVKNRDILNEISTVFDTICGLSGMVYNLDSTFPGLGNVKYTANSPEVALNQGS
ncbi:MAG: nitroreductase family protein, partial [Clostridia bacterium]